MFGVPIKDLVSILNAKAVSGAGICSDDCCRLANVENVGVVK